MTWLLNIFSNIKNIGIFLFGIIGVSYVAKQKYDAYKAESKLQDIETQIAKTNVVVAKKKAKAKAQAKEVEHDTEVQILRELKTKREETLKEMDTIQEKIETSKKEAREAKETKIVKRKIGKKMEIEV